MKNNTTVAVYGENFVGRVKEKKECQYYLEQGNSILILGLRRLGKSSMLLELESIIKNPNAKTISIDCQDIVTPESFILTLLKQLPDYNGFLKNLKGVPKRIIEELQIDGVKAFGVELSFKDSFNEYWGEIAKAFEKSIASDEKIILFIDELPFFFENLIEKGYGKNDIVRILSTLRAWRNKGVCMAISGSIQIDHFLDSHNISNKLLAGLIPISLHPFQKEEAYELLDNLAKGRGVKLNEPVKNKVLSLIKDNLPFFIQSFFAQMAIHNSFSEDSLSDLYEFHYFEQIEKTFLYQFDERYVEFTKDEQDIAKDILNNLVSFDSLNIEELRSKTKNFSEQVFLKLLKDEFLIKKTASSVSFALNIIKVWWNNKYSKK